jgi:hypothetical protein
MALLREAQKLRIVKKCTQSNYLKTIKKLGIRRKNTKLCEI